MAVYNELQVGRYVRFFQKFFGIKGRQPAPLTYQGEIGSILSLFHGAENRYLEGWNRFGFGFSVAAAATFTSGFRYRNPANSRVVAVFEKIAFNAGVATGFAILFGADTADLGSLAVQTFARLDPRGNPNPSIIGSFQNSAATLPALTGTSQQIGTITCPANDTRDFVTTDIQEIPLLPGDAIQFGATAVNTAVNGSVIWRERVMEESELQ